VPWEEGSPGVDVFVALLENPDQATDEQLRIAKHLRIGVNFDRILKEDTPRVIAQMVYFTLIVGFIMVMGLVILLTYITSPLRQLRLGFMAVAGGNLDYRVPVESKDEVGQVVRMFNATIDRLSRAFHEIEMLARRDPLTGLPNRRAFDERLGAEAARSRRYGHPFGLIILDLDHFKSVNDHYGHPAGDEVLKFVAKLIEANVRETDLAARIGGEEFAVILPESGIGEVKAVADKLRESVGDTPFQVQGLPAGMRITLSAGGTCSAGHLVTPESIVAAADAALFRSKNEGRNRVTVGVSQAGKTSMMPRIEDPAAPQDPPGGVHHSNDVVI
jgi:diguanylate cyclase (GGDEF)-like protein